MPDFSMWNYRTQYIDACTLHSRLKARVADLRAERPCPAGRRPGGAQGRRGGG